MTALLLIFSLHAPTICPPDAGTIRWDDFSYSFKVGGKAHDVVGPIWDVDRNSRPSAGDLMRVDSATIGGNAISIEPAWLVIEGRLADAMAKKFDTVVDSLKTACMEGMTIQGPARIKTNGELAKHVKSFEKAPVKMSVEQELEKAMFGWAGEKCTAEKFIEYDALHAWLMKNSKRSFKDVAQEKRADIGAKVARKAHKKCLHLKPKISF